MKILRLSLIVLFLGLTSAVFAQTGQTPYLNSTQTYLITMEDGTNNSGDWIIADASGAALTPQPTTVETVAGNEAKLVIAWSQPWAAASLDGNPNFTIQFKETDGTNSCISVRSADITIKDNTFFIIAGANSDECHDKTGEILAENAIETTELNYNVTLDATTFALGITSWNFDLAFADGTYTVTKVLVNTVDVTSALNGISIDGTLSTVPVVVTVSGLVTNAETITLTVSNGKAIDGVISTPDNGSGNKSQAITVNALPSTSEIRFN